ncbi:hypothetical protein JAK47_06520 [Stenotrophomonas maltophilia]|uniref:hypothetical protein n=1 Tax=Stenotrophomonas maltophilia TaxID=40324 RepID=UPI0021C72964|nr:hypothetical protein [Stenotrophomonas maltophilia]MCU1054188.1 hypothetical protein [Stenotrophomonas maltophilia]
MSKVDIVGRGGRMISVHHRVAAALEQRGGYLRRDMVAQSPVAPNPSAKGPAPGKAKKKAKKPAAKAGQPNKDASV